MPWQSLAGLPDNVRGTLPTHAQDVYRDAFNSGYEEYRERGRARAERAR